MLKLSDILWISQTRRRERYNMKIYGLQKLTLLDYPGKTACTVFTGGCNFRCPFCHNASLVTALEPADAMEPDALFAFLKKRQGILDGVCITGGEPLLDRGTPALIAEIKALGYSVKLDTNGSYPAMLRQLVRDNLVDYVAMDIKNAPDRYAETVGLPQADMDAIRESVAFLKSGAVAHEFRTTVVRELHDTDSIRQIGLWLAGEERFFLQKFVDSGNTIADGLHACSDKEMLELLHVARQYLPQAQLRGVDLPDNA